MKWNRGKVLFPQTWGKEMNLKGGMGIDPLQHIEKKFLRFTPSTPRWPTLLVHATAKSRRDARPR